jgi:hypothetical protein
MSTKIKAEVPNSPKKTTWEKSESVNGFTKRIVVREIENGFVARVSEYGEVKGKYIDKEREVYFKENPLFQKSVEEQSLESLKKAFSDSPFESLKG